VKTEQNTVARTARGAEKVAPVEHHFLELIPPGT
jgi:hypothetical protein